MPAIGSDFSRASALNSGLWRERGIVRTSARHSTPWAFRIARKASSDRLECPTVRTVSGMVFQDNPAGRMLDPRMKKGDKVKPSSPFILTLAPHPGAGDARRSRSLVVRLVALGRRLRRRSPLGRSGCALDGGGGRGRALIGGGGLLGRGLRRLLRCRGLLLSRLAGARHREQDDENGRAAGPDLPRLCHGVVHLSPTPQGGGSTP